MIMRFEPGQNYYKPGIYVTQSKEQVESWEAGKIKPEGYALVPENHYSPSSWVRDYVVWGWVPGPEENEFGVVSP